MADHIGDWKDINPPEESRTYVYPGGEVTIKNVSRVCVRPSGSHRIETTDGSKYIVNTGWYAIRFTADKWTF